MLPVVQFAWGEIMQARVQATLLILTLICVRAAAMVEIGYENDNRSLTVTGAATTFSTNGVRLGYKGNHNRLNILNGASMSSAESYIGWTSYEFYYGDGIPADDNVVNVAGVGSRWDAGRLRVGFGPSSVNNQLRVAGGGEVEAESCLIGVYAGNANQVLVSDPGSRLTVTESGDFNGFTIGYRGGGHALIVSNGASLASADAIIGYGHFIYPCEGNRALISGAGTTWNSGAIQVGTGPYALNNALVIRDGAVVHSTSARIETVASEPRSIGNHVAVEGVGSKWNLAQGLVMKSYDPLTPSELAIADGGEVEASWIAIFDDAEPASQIHLYHGGTLTIRSDFDASMPGFSFNDGGTLRVGGQLSGLSALDAGRRLEASDLLGSLTLEGTFAPGNSPAESTLSGDLTVAAIGTLEMELGGYALGAEYDHLTVTGTATLDGTLSVLFMDGFSVTNGARFDLFDWEGGASGRFSSIVAPTLSSGLSWDSSELYSTGHLSVIPEPGTAGLLLVAGAGLYLSRSRRARSGTCRRSRRWRR